MTEDNEAKNQYMLKIVGGRLKFGNDEILSGLNMNVPKGKMYTLLGSSGCGKTTLLNCIVHANKLDSGRIYRQWRSFSEIGYMPQEIALNPYLTIKELFKYFNKVHNCNNSELTKFTEIANILELPPCNRLLGELSGGEQRRVSLAVTILHGPKFLILDEPTVGQDPLLRQRIWDFLLKVIERSNKTVLVTTHYIEEATHSNIVGMMRKGVMVAEDTPSALMERFEGSSLEKTFLQLSALQEEQLPLLSQDSALDSLRTVKAEISTMDSGHPADEKFDNRIIKSSRLLAELQKNIWSLWHNKTLLGFHLLVPIIVQIIWQTSIGAIPNHIQLGVINDELYGNSGKCSPEMNSPSCSDNGLLSCYYIHRVKSKFDLIPYENVNSAISDVTRGKIWGLIHFPENYTQALITRALDTAFKIVEGMIKKSILTVWLDSSSYIIYIETKRKLSETLMDLLDELFAVCHWGRPNFLPFAYHDPIYGSWNISHIEATTPAYLIVLFMYFGSLYPAAVLVEEKAASILKRASVSGVTAFEIILALFLICCLLCSVQVVGNFFVIFVVFQIPCRGSIISIFIIALCSTVFGILYGILTACLTKSPAIGILSSTTLANVVTILSGTMWPQETQAPQLQFFKWLCPGSYPTDSLRFPRFCRGAWFSGVDRVVKEKLSNVPLPMLEAFSRSAMVKGQPFSDFNVYSGFLYLVGYNAVLSAAICLTLWRSKALNVG